MEFKLTLNKAEVESVKILALASNVSLETMLERIVDATILKEMLKFEWDAEQKYLRDSHEYTLNFDDSTMYTRIK